MLKAIQNNPYRFLGVYSNSSARDRLGNERRLNAYIGRREVEFPTDLPSLLQKYDRTKEDLEQAKSAINLPADQLKHALFWFINSSPIDKMALEYLINGDTSKAMELFGKKETFSSLINKGVLSFIMGDEGTGIACLTKVIHTAEYLKQFASTVCGNTFVISADEASALFLEVLQKELPLSRLLKLYETYGYSKDDIAVLRSNAIKEPISVINSAISEAKSIPTKDANAQYKAGTELMNVARENLPTLKKYLSTDEMQLHLVSDNLAKQVLQCGINYYNASKDSKKPTNTMPLLEYALSIAISKNVVDRIKTNISSLKEAIENMPLAEVQEHIEAIMRLIDEFNGKRGNHNKRAVDKSSLFPDFLIDDTYEPWCNRRDKKKREAEKAITKAHILLNHSKSHLDAIGKKVGKSNELYIKISTSVVDHAMGKICDAVNNIQKKDPLDLDPILNQVDEIRLIAEIVEKARAQIIFAASFDMENGYRRNRFNKNKDAIENMSSQLDKILYPNKHPEPSGCMIIIAIIMTLSAIIACTC